MAIPMTAPEDPNIAELRKNDVRYRLRRWNAYAMGRKDADSEDFKAFAAAYDAASDALTLDDPARGELQR